MVYKFRMISTLDKAFLRDYEINSDCSFIDFHRTIQHNLGFDENQLASFFLADEEWNKGLELTLLDMKNEDGPVAVPMDTVRIGDLLRNRKDRLLYVFDIFTDQHLFLELIDIFEPEKGVQYPRCSASVGEAPLQLAADGIDFDVDSEVIDDFNDLLDDEVGFNPDELDEFGGFDEDNF